MTGRFVDGRSKFTSDEEWDRVLVRVRFLWTDISETTARCEQAFFREVGHRSVVERRLDRGPARPLGGRRGDSSSRGITLRPSAGHGSTIPPQSN